MLLVYIKLRIIGGVVTKYIYIYNVVNQFSSVTFPQKGVQQPFAWLACAGAGRSKGGQARSEQLGHEGYQEMGKKGGSATSEQSGGDAAAAAGREIDESKFTLQEVYKSAQDRSQQLF